MGYKMLDKIQKNFMKLQRKNNPMKDHKFVYCDVDNTLLMHDSLMEVPNKKRVKMKLFGKTYYLRPNKTNINKVKQLYKKGFTCALWSAAGRNWAKQACKALKLQKYFKYILPKPYYFIDDKEPSVWAEVNLYQSEEE